MTQDNKVAIPIRPLNWAQISMDEYRCKTINGIMTIFDEEELFTLYYEDYGNSSIDNPIEIGKYDNFDDALKYALEFHIASIVEWLDVKSDFAIKDE